MTPADYKLTHLILTCCPVPTTLRKVKKRLLKTVFDSNFDWASDFFKKIQTVSQCASS